LSQGGEEFLEKIAKEPELVEAWKVLKESDAFRKSIKHLQKVDNFIKNSSKSIEQLSKSFNASQKKLDWFKYLDDEFEVMYRSVSEEEYEQLLRSNFNFHPKDKYINGRWVGYDGYEGKLFTKTYLEAKEHSKALNNPVIIEVKVSKKYFDELYKFVADDKSAIAVDITQLDVFNGLHISRKVIK